ncbi:predicted acyltransferase [Chthonomonas calidirosea]|nr:predicted acyltransferase [Chthonomonas calidirosea]
MPKGVWDYFKRRARRILPPYYTSLLLILALIVFDPALQRPPFASDWDTAFPVLSKAGVLTHLLLVHNLSSHGYNIDPPMWSVALEWQIYFLFPFVLLPLWRRFSTLAPLLITIAFSYGILQSGLPIYPWTAPWLLTCFVFGMAAALINFQQASYQKLCYRIPWYVLTLLFFLCAFWVRLRAHTHLLSATVIEPSDAIHNTHNLLTGMATACFIAGTVRSLQQNRRNLFLHLLSSKPLVSLGGFSYSLYLVHYPLVATIFFAFVSWCGRVAGWFWLLLGGVPLIVGIAYLFHYVFERPFLPTHLRMPKRATKPLDQRLTGAKSEPE